MQNSSLIEILKTFDKEQMKEYRDFVSSPYFNKKSGALKFFDYIKKYYPEFSSEKLLKENIWRAIFPGKAYNYGIMKNLIYTLTKLAEEYISISYYQKNENRTEINILKYLHEKKSVKASAKYIDRAIKRIDHSESRDSEYYRNKFDIEKVRITSLFSQLSDKHNVKSIDKFEQSGIYLIESYIISVLEHYVMITNINKIHKTGIKTPLLNELLDFVSTNRNFLNNFYIEAYYYILMLDKSDDEEYYYKLKEILSNLGKNVSSSFKYAVWSNVCNYITFKYHRGDYKALREEFDLYKISLDKKIFSTENEEYFFAASFLTYFSVGMQLGEYEWVENFINEYSKKLDPAASEDIKNYCHASLCTRRKKFSDSIEFSSKIKKLHDPHMKCGLKLMILVNYFELGWDEPALNAVDSFKHLLENDRNIQEVIKVKYKKFIRAYLMLLEYKNKKDINTELKFKKYISETNEINSFQWIKRKAKEIGIEI